VQYKTLSTWLRSIATIFAAVLFLTSARAADHLTVPYNFEEPATSSLIRDAAGNLYGTGEDGNRCGDDPCGLVYELSPVEGGGWTKTVLYNFNGTTAHGPNGLVMDAAGNLYGMTFSGGLYGGGTAYELSRGEGGGWTETVLYNFSSGSHFGYANYTLWRDAAGNLYGTTLDGGTYGAGMVFELSSSGGGAWTETVLWSFGNGSDGEYPESGVIMDAAGNLYGTTLQGGTYCQACGIVYELSPSQGGNWSETVLHNFNENDGWEPWASLILDAAGNLYGTTGGGGAYSEGIAFEVSPHDGGWTETVLHSFGNGNDGSFLQAPLILDPTGNLFGTTQGGGTNHSGIVFELSPRQGGWIETVLYDFGNGGGFPLGGVVMDRAGDLYGTTESGGLYHEGTAYELTPPAIRPGVSSLH